MARPKSPRINSWCGWDPLEEVWVGRHHLPEYFDTIKHSKVREPLKKIARETEEDNNELINFIDTYLSHWVGYCAESVFDVNMLALDQNNVVVNDYNKKIFHVFKKHKIEPIICNLRHRFFWDGGLHCNTLDIRRNGKKQRYLNF